MTCEDVEQEDLEVRCPKCESPLDFALLSLSAEQKQAGGKQLRCPKYRCLLWVATDGQIKAASGCGDEILNPL